MKKFTVVVYREVTERAFVTIEAETASEAEGKFYDDYPDGVYDDLFDFKDEQVNVEAVREVKNNA